MILPWWSRAVNYAEALGSGVKRLTARILALAASSSLLFAGALVCRELRSLWQAASIASTAPRNAGSLVFDGLVKPDTLRTNCSEAARTSASVTGGSKLNKILMLLHMGHHCCRWAAWSFKV